MRKIPIQADTIARHVSILALAVAGCWIAEPVQALEGRPQADKPIVVAQVFSIRGVKRDATPTARTFGGPTLRLRALPRNRLPRAQRTVPRAAARAFAAPALGNPRLSLSRSDAARVMRLRGFDRAHRLSRADAAGRAKPSRKAAGTRPDWLRANRKKSMRRQGIIARKLPMTRLYHPQASRGAMKQPAAVGTTTGIDSGASLELESTIITTAPERARLVYLTLLGLPVRGAAPSAGVAIFLGEQGDAGNDSAADDGGGRHTPVFSGYRPQFYFRTTDVTGDRRFGTGFRAGADGAARAIVTRPRLVILDEPESAPRRPGYGAGLRDFSLTPNTATRSDGYIDVITMLPGTVGTGGAGKGSSGD